MLYGYSELIMDGARMTLQLALCSLVLSLLIGLVGAAAKLSSSRLLSGFFFWLYHPDSRRTRPGADAADFLWVADGA
ncbi:hypothetical protein OS31_18060 [Dickeya oryzae]